MKISESPEPRPVLTDEEKQELLELAENITEALRVSERGELLVPLLELVGEKIRLLGYADDDKTETLNLTRREFKILHFAVMQTSWFDNWQAFRAERNQITSL